ncbi:MAG TPA: hydrogen peroxide-dependent heme synthase [Actinomycetota bacterium]|nr:hydrogen peroxide-dependent heme synthase [Actinomycetota bacterium]
MSQPLTFAGYAMFKASGRDPGADTARLASEVEELFAKARDSVEVRGVYSTTGFTARADVMFWFTSNSSDRIQDLLVELRRTDLGRSLIAVDTWMGVALPAEFAKDHQPAFVKGEPPKKYMTVYPFVRTPEWYLLDPKERGALLREHGEAGREFADVLANTTSAFGLGDFEWLLCFEADGPERIVELIRRLRATEARRFTKVEIPFYTGIRKELSAAVEDVR